MLQRIRELAVQGASDTYSENDKKALQSEIDELTKVGGPYIGRYGVQYKVTARWFE